jgi:hypothetical protein
MPMAIVAASSAEAVADDLPERWKRAELSVGAYLATFGSDLQVDPTISARAPIWIWKRRWISMMKSPLYANYLGSYCISLAWIRGF